MKKLDNTISVIEMLQLLEKCKTNKNVGVDEIDVIEYYNLISKYRDKTEKLLQLQDISYEYFIYKNILEDDRDKYLEMVNNCFMLNKVFNKHLLNKVFNKHYSKKALYNKTSKLVKEDIVNKMIKKPNEMKEILFNCLDIINNNRQFFKGVDVNSKNLLNRATHQHVADNSYYFFQSLIKYIDEGKDLYDTILKDKNINVNLSNNYFQFIAKDLSDGFNDDLLFVKEKFQESKNNYILKKKVLELEGMDADIINVALKFIWNNECNSFRVFVRNSKLLSGYPVDVLLNKIKLIDNNLYNSILMKELKRKDVIMNYLNNDYSSFDYFLKANNISKDTFDVLLENVKEIDSLNYHRFITKYNDQVLKYDDKFKEAMIITNKIINGVTDNKGNFREYNFLDYNLDTNLSLEEFIIILKSNTSVRRDDLIKVLKFAKKQLTNTTTNSFNLVIMSDVRINKDYYGVKGRMITDD